jgi:hypothetical protein
MNTVKVDILNPKAEILLKNLADLNLISIKKDSNSSGFKKAIEKLRSKADLAPSLDEITEEVKKVREKRYSK